MLLAAGPAALAQPAPAPAPKFSSGPSSGPITLRDLRGASARPVIDPASAALVIIDAQQEYVRGPLALEGMPQALAEIRRLRAWAAAHHVPVIHVQQVSPPGSAVFAAGSPGDEILPEAAPAPGEPVVTKLYPNAFNKTDLQPLLQRLGRRQLILTGFMAHMCLDSTSRAAFDLDYQVFVVASATAERAIPGPDGSVLSAADLRRATLTALNDRFAWVLPSAAALEAGE
ncbi:cysteine hydrolase [Phenylobacterium soli]|uniref:Cysteine hydrolase n=2 Tax=Phenylobacterium soli TaxID=2170551 RepID=A0A328AS82_9CAUL|nr:cysteine hydrolase [Phenylobacterium soli]